MRRAGFLLLILSVVSISGVPVTPDLKSENVTKIQPNVKKYKNGGSQAALSGTLFKTVMRYYCSIPVLDDDSAILTNSTTILYGSKGWTFPQQDVNLTLSYPTSDQEIQRGIADYRISGYELLMFTDGTNSTGSIVSGGIMQKHITLSFDMSGISVLSYEFWLYGVPAAARVSKNNHTNYNRLC